MRTLTKELKGNCARGKIDFQQASFRLGNCSDKKVNLSALSREEGCGEMMEQNASELRPVSATLQNIPLSKLMLLLP